MKLNIAEEVEVAELYRKATNAKDAPLMSVPPALILSLLKERAENRLEIEAHMRVHLRFAQGIVDEREACAQAVEKAGAIFSKKKDEDRHTLDVVATFRALAASIRKRGEPKPAGAAPAR